MWPFRHTVGAQKKPFKSMRFKMFVKLYIVAKLRQLSSWKLHKIKDNCFFAKKNYSNMKFYCFLLPAILTFMQIKTSILR